LVLAERSSSVRGGSARPDQKPVRSRPVTNAPLGEPAQPPSEHASQQLVALPTQALPPGGATHIVVDAFVLQRVLPRALVRQQVTKPGFPHVDLAAQRFTRPLQFRGSRFASARALATPAAQPT
jgi:hypothetical protein